MAEQTSGVWTFYRGWDVYQDLLVRALAPLTPEQLDLRAAPQLRSIEENATHIIGARARWFHLLFGIGDQAFAAFGEWDRPNMPIRSAAELVEGLRASWQVVQETLGRWTPDDLERTYPNIDREPDEPEAFTAQWVIWHLIEHDVFHGGEISLILGMHGLPGLAL
jgi:uncharacterized damage-inducible protein DinB